MTLKLSSVLWYFSKLLFLIQRQPNFSKCLKHGLIDSSKISEKHKYNSNYVPSDKARRALWNTRERKDFTYPERQWKIIYWVANYIKMLSKLIYLHSRGCYFSKLLLKNVFYCTILITLRGSFFSKTLGNVIYLNHHWPKNLTKVLILYLTS